MEKRFFPKIIKISLTLIAALLIVLTSSYFLSDNASAKGQDTCPQTGDWVKVDGINAQTYTYTAPEGKQIVETCYKAGTTLRYNTVNPPVTQIKLVSDVLNPSGNNFQDISHASFRLEKIPVTPTPTFTNTPTDEPSPTPTFTNTPTDEPSPTPTFTFTPTPTDESDLIPLTISGLCSDAVVGLALPQGDDVTITWQVSNANDNDISFNWTANNGQNGSGTAPANSSTSFITDISGSAVTLAYTLNEESMEELASVEACDPQQETEEPTPEPTEEPTDEPTPAPTDSQPDQPAGGSGPSLASTLLPLIYGITFIGTISIIVMILKKQPTQ
jgi:hypothetical protein